MFLVRCTQVEGCQILSPIMHQCMYFQTDLDFVTNITNGIWARPYFQNGWPKHTPSSILRVLTYEILESYWCKIFDKLHVWFQNSYNFNQYLAHRLSFQSYGSCSLSGTLDLLQFSHNTLDICIQTIPTPRHITVWHNVSLSMVGGDS